MSEKRVKAPKRVVDASMKSVVYTLAKSKNGKYPPSYKIPSQDEVYLEWIDDDGVEQKGLRSIRYCLGERSIFVDEQSFDARKGVLIFNDGVLVAEAVETSKQKYLEYTNANIVNHEQGSSTPGKSPIFRPNSSNYKLNIKLQRQEQIIKLSQMVNDMSDDQLEGLSISLNVPFDSSTEEDTIKSIQEAKSRFFDMINFDPTRFEKELKDETRKYREVIGLALNKNIISFEKAERSFYNNIGGKTRILDVPSYEDPEQYFVKLSLTKTEIKEAYLDIEKALNDNKKPAKEKFEGTKEYKMIQKALKLKVCKNAFGSISANNIGILGERGTGIKGATKHLEYKPEVYTKIEEMVLAAEDAAE
tara:strand:- start:1482 stop:2564 length:1083 start_codon:yes stop_codon:yes gene_type:complete